MPPKTPHSTTPADFARAALRRLAEQGLAPTPGRYRQAYLSVAAEAGAVNAPAPSLLSRLSGHPIAQTPLWPALRAALDHEDWDSALELMAGAVAAGGPPTTGAASGAGLGQSVARFVREWGRSQVGVSHLQKLQVAQQLESIAEPAQVLDYLRATTERWSSMRDRPQPSASPDPGVTRGDDDAWRRLWMDAVRMTEQVYTDQPRIQAQAHALLADANESVSLSATFKTHAQTLWDACEQWHTQSAGARKRLVEVFRLLLDNVAELFDPTHWVQGQVADLHGILQEPLEFDRIERALVAMKDLLFKQGVLQKAGDDARSVARELIEMIVLSLGAYVDSTTRFGDDIEQGLRDLSQSDDWDKAKSVVQGILSRSQSMLEDTRQLRQSFADAQATLTQAQARAANLEAELHAVSELLQQDPLTGALNRRGLELAFRREEARAQRDGEPLGVAMVDLDHFKRVNDAYGHDLGDLVLKDLVRALREHLRPTDVVARMGGEEFMLLLPGENAEAARLAVGRVQAAFAARKFTHPRKPDGLHVRFSAGVTDCQPDESFEAVYVRADQALLRAKQGGRNRIEVQESVSES